MRTKTFLISLACLFIATTLFAKRRVVKVERITASLILSDAVDYHITASEECIAAGATVNLAHEDAWLFFDNVRPTEVKSKWLPSIKVNGKDIVAQKTAWINVYTQGTAIIPYAEDFAPLTVFTGELYAGESQSYIPGRYQSLGAFDNTIKSFKLKRGYMATLAQGKDGSGYSRCFIAQDEDIEISNLLDKNSCKNGGALYNKTSFIRVMRWQMPGKKGAVDSDPDLTDCTWYYDYNAGNASKNENLDYANMWHNKWWNNDAPHGSMTDISGVTHTLGFNEPWGTAQEGLGFDPLAPIPYQYELIKNGTRIGSVAPTDADIDKLLTFIKECDRLGLRIDFVALHLYQYHDPSWWYSFTKEIYDKTKRPIWITEFNNGANWTSEPWPGISWTTDEEGNKVRKIDDLPQAREKQKELLTAVCEKLNEAPWVERYSVYSHVELWRGIIEEDDKVTLTPAGLAYKNLKSGLAYNSSYEFIPVYPQFEKPTVEVNTAFLINLGEVRIKINEKNGEYFDKYVLEKKTGNGNYEIVKEETTGNTTSLTDKWDLENPHKTAYRVSFYYCNETSPRFTEETTVDMDVAETGPVRYGTASFSKPDWAYIMYEPFDGTATGMPIFGGVPSVSIANQANQFCNSLYPVIGKNNFRAKLIPWGYIYNYNEASLKNLDYKSTAQIPYMIVDTTATSLQNARVESGLIKRIGNEWVKINFKKTFEEIPVVFTTLLSNRNFGENKGPAYIRVRNVTKDGFELHMTRESKLNSSTWPIMGEDVGYYALTPGTIKIANDTSGDTLNIVVARTPEVNGSLISTVTTQFPASCPDHSVPVLVSALQTCNDEYTSTLVYSLLTHENVKFYKVDEKSTSSTNNLRFKKDAVGYMLFYTTTNLSGLETVADHTTEFTVYEQDGILYTEGLRGNALTLYTSNGVQIHTATTENGMNIENLPKGHYIIRSNMNETAKFIKK